ncbi:hypothetical protein [Desulfatibacillum aliphaticivorans]|nr:hypothetical protein [Desulfatibacillum aliphaticivorans]
MKLFEIMVIPALDGVFETQDTIQKTPPARLACRGWPGGLNETGEIEPPL